MLLIPYPDIHNLLTLFIIILDNKTVQKRKLTFSSSQIPQFHIVERNVPQHPHHRSVRLPRRHRPSALEERQSPPYGKLYALVRSKDQGEQVQKLYGAEPLVLNVSDHETVTQTIIDKEITIVYYLIDAYSAKHQLAFIRGLGEVKKKTGKDVHFLHTTGSKQFSRHAGVYANQVLLDTDPRLYDIQKGAKSKHQFAAEVS